jgi:CDP-glycerol glycerophosphotransferase (TagB/SpsB family)
MLKKIKYAVNFALSLFFVLFYILRKKINRNKIWLFGAGNGQYENNIAVFHDYVLNKHTSCSDEIYFITTNTDLLGLRSNFPYLLRGQIKTYALSMIADYLIFDTCNSDIAPGIHKYLKGIKVNVNHGFEGLKKLPRDYYANIDADVHCASSEKEKDIKVSQCGAHRENVYITGYPRFDQIFRDLNKDIKNILFFPTWRNWLEFTEDEALNQTDYVQSIREFLLNDKLRTHLADNHITLYYKPHYKLKHLKLNELGNSNIIFLNAHDDLTQYIRNADMLITDYSSVTWDFIYNNRKVLFYVFDIEKYKDQQGLYYDVTSESINNYSATAEGISDLVIKYSTVGSELSSKMALDFFQFRDAKNCQRLLTLIRELTL